jgi:16S rRNA G966 N2-methylase RsmD
LQARAVSVERADAVAWMRAATGRRFHLVLLDPPFEDIRLLEHALKAATHLVAADGFLYIESGQPQAEPPEGFGLWRHDRAGAVRFHLLRRNSSG